MRYLILLLLLLAPNISLAQIGYIDTTYDYRRCTPCNRSYRNYYPAHLYFPVHPTLPLHAVRKQQFMAQYNAQKAGIPGLIARKAARRQAKLARLHAGISPFTGQPK